MSQTHPAFGSVSHIQPPTATPDWQIGAKVLVDGTKSGVLKFCGPVRFSEGTWCGVELDLPIGKNDGSVNG